MRGAEAPPGAAPAHPSPGKLFVGFLSVAAVGFGGVMPWLRRMLVERRSWLTAEEFNDLLALCQFLPGSNVVNLAVAVGARFGGLRGAIAATTGILAVPVAVAMAAAAAYARWGGIETVRGALTGIGAAAAGLVIAMAVKMAAPLLRKRPVQAVPFILAAFVAVGLLRWPLEWVVLALCPLSVVVHWRWRA